MSTPLRKAAEDYMQSGFSRLHMPGHKGEPVFPVGEGAAYDLTEINGTDSLYEADGAISQSEKRYCDLYGSAATFFSAGGSTLCIQTMLALVAKPGAKIICERGVHISAVNAMALLGIEPVWIFPQLDESTGVSKPVQSEQVQRALEQNHACAVFLTSPSYLGIMADIKAIAAVCKKAGAPLLVDNAHGAHLKFLAENMHPISQGATMCCDSLHKTLPVLTGGALLHIADTSYIVDAKRRMSLFGSTSPSYLIMLSIDGALPYIEKDLAGDLQRVTERVSSLKKRAVDVGFCLPKGLCEPTRLTVGFSPLGFSREDMAVLLNKYKIEPEYLSGAFCVLLLSGFSNETDYTRIEEMLSAAGEMAKPAQNTAVQPVICPTQAMSVRDAVFASSEIVSVAQAEGRICAGIVAPCPPGTAVVVAGELIDKSLCERLMGYGIFSVNVVK